MVASINIKSNVSLMNNCQNAIVNNVNARIKKLQEINEYNIRVIKKESVRYDNRSVRKVPVMFSMSQIIGPSLEQHVG